jgi:hypothetical protein
MDRGRAHDSQKHRLAMAVAAFMLAACAQPAVVPSAALPTEAQTVVTTRLAALLGPAELTFDDECLRVGGYVLVWPPDFSVARSGNVYTLTDLTTGEAAVWHVGDVVALGGGEIRRASIEAEAGQRWSGECEGANAYWLVGGINVQAPATAAPP